MSNSPNFFRFLSALLVLVPLGCGSGTSPLAEVSGTVSYQGERLQGGTIVFTPDASRGTHGSLALGKIQSDGHFTLYTKNDPGAVPGWHRITIVSFEATLTETQGQEMISPRMILPQKYQSPTTSGLVREVKANEPNVIDLELE